MDLRPLGATGVEVSMIGFGAFKIGRNQKTKYAESYDLPGQEEVDQLLDTITDAGISLIDTAPAYGCSEERIGAWLKRSGARNRIILATKVGEEFEAGRSHYAFDRNSINRSIDRSLTLLGVDRLDIVNVHSNGEDLRIIDQTDVLEVLATRRDQGDLGVVGFSGKTLAGHRRAIEHPVGIRSLMIELNLEDSDQAPILEEAHERGIGILIKKGLASGRAGAEESLSWLLANRAISSVVIGSRSAGHMCENLAIARALR
ncbi:MAG: aldo/keto reductase [Planctomycetota bacterium]|nr:aldo/keto reductase [Planctomycetota bacterium]